MRMSDWSSGVWASDRGLVSGAGAGGCPASGRSTKRPCRAWGADHPGLATSRLGARDSAARAPLLQRYHRFGGVGIGAVAALALGAIERAIGHFDELLG